MPEKQPAHEDSQHTSFLMSLMGRLIIYTDAMFILLENNNLLYIIVCPNTADKLHPLGLSVNKAAKDFFRSQFQLWYAEKICISADTTSASDGGTASSLSSHVTHVDLKLSTMKSIGAKWMIEYFLSKPDIRICVAVMRHIIRNLHIPVEGATNYFKFFCELYMCMNL